MSNTIGKYWVSVKIKLITLMMMVCIVFPSIVASAMVNSTPSVQVMIGSVSGNPGTDVEVPISFANVTTDAAINNCDFSIGYDQTKLSFVSISQGLIVKNSSDFNFNNVTDGSNQSTGQICFLFNDESDNNTRYITDSGVFAKIKFHIKSSVATGSSITIEKRSLGACSLPDANLTTREVTFTSGNISVVQQSTVDRLTLSTAIQNATTLIASKTVGTAVGNVPQAAKTAFQATIDAATLVLNDTNATQTQIDNQVNALATATIAFNNAIIKDTVDVEVTIGNVTGNRGSIVEVPIDLTKIPNNGISGFTIRLTYDSTQMVYKGIDKTDSILSSNFSLVASETATKKIVLVGSNSTPSNNPIKNAGDICKIQFLINKDAQIGKYLVSREDSAQVQTKFTSPVDQSVYSNSLIKDGSVNVKVIKYGDVTGDGNVDISDYNYVQLYLLESIDKFPATDGLVAADVTGDGLIDISDYNYIQLYLLESIDKFPADK